MKLITKPGYQCPQCLNNPINCKCISSNRITFISFVIIFIISCSLFAQNNGYLHIKGTTMDTCNKPVSSVILITDTANDFIKTIDVKGGKFNFNLPLNSAYIITFLKEKHVSKSVLVSTAAYPEVPYAFVFDVIMLGTGIQKDPIPVAYVYFSTNERSFSYKILSQVAQRDRRLGR